MRAPKGDGHPVLALPGFLASDLSMAPMRRYLKELGYDAHAWNMGRNLGGVVRGCAARCATGCAAIHAADRPQGQPGRLEPRRRLCARSGAAGAGHGALRVTLGSPFANDIRATNATRLYEALSGEAVDDNPELRDGDRRRPAGAGHLDLFAHRRHRELAHLPAASLRYRREHRGPSRQPYRARRQSRRAVGGGRSSGAARGRIQAI